jgi:uncharacterized protein
MGAVPVHEGLFARDDTGAPYLIGGHCGQCGRDHFPRRAECPYCGASDAEETRLPTTGRLWGWTAVLNAPPGYRGDVPFGFGVVELDGDGLRVITRIEEPDPARLAFEQPMQLALVPLHVDDDGNPVETYTFEPR